jgi:proteasome lid subunit RPN8/RPN11
MIEAIVRHARDEAPNEACGVIVGDRAAADGGTPRRWVAARNKAASPYRYEIDPEELLRLTLELDEADESFWAIVHSHVRSAPRPSPTDRSLAYYPDALYVLVSLEHDEPEVRAYRILEGETHEVELRVTK